LCATSEEGVTTFTVDAQRDHGTTEKLMLRGRGVGLWEYNEAAQEVEDVLGRVQPQSARRVMDKERLRALMADEPSWSLQGYADHLDLGKSTVARYRRELLAEAPTAALDGTV
jgi:hypothetical protein